MLGPTRIRKAALAMRFFTHYPIDVLFAAKMIGLPGIFQLAQLLKTKHMLKHSKKSRLYFHQSCRLNQAIQSWERESIAERETVLRIFKPAHFTCHCDDGGRRKSNPLLVASVQSFCQLFPGRHTFSQNNILSVGFKTSLTEYNFFRGMCYRFLGK